MVGAFVIILDPIFQGLAVSLLFGVGASTLLTLVVIPVLYYHVRGSRMSPGFPMLRSCSVAVRGLPGTKDRNRFRFSFETVTLYNRSSTEVPQDVYRVSWPTRLGC